jgi:hypothetical protein
MFLLNLRQLFISLALGVVFWLNAALIIRWVGPAALSDGSLWVPILLGVTLPLGAFTLVIYRWALGLAWGQLFTPLVLGTSIAMLLDGLALTYFKSLYGDALVQVQLGGALIFFGAGVGQFLAYFLAARSATASS